MINSEQISINVKLPSDEVDVVTMQPLLNLNEEEPFKIQEEHIKNQLDSIKRTLLLAQNYSNGNSSHFTVFPEYSIPGIKGIELIEEKISSQNWSKDSIILAGIHGLTKEEYQEVLSNFDAEVSNDNKPQEIPDDRWVNCCFIWIKESDGNIRRFIQLKVRPSWPENSVRCNEMYCGKTIYIFEGNFRHKDQIQIHCRFTTFICFDWVAPVAGSTVRDEMLKSLQDQVTPNETPLHWVFVIQHNTSPNHTSFLNSTVDFVSDKKDDFPLIRRNESVIFHVNTAAKKAPTKLSKEIKGAFSACVLPPIEQIDCNGCKPTICMQPYHFRGSKILKDNQLKDIVFRETGECIHRFKVKVPRFLKGGAIHRTHPISNAEVHSLRGDEDPRTSGNAIPASVKWLNDSLDYIELLSNRSLKECNLSDVAEAAQSTITALMRKSNGQKIEDQISWATSLKVDNVNERRKNPDLWYLEPTFEVLALEHTIFTLTNFGIAYELEISNSSYHGAIVLEDKYIQVIAVKGDSYSDCRLHYDNYVPKEEIDPVIVVFRDKDGQEPTNEEYKKYYEVEGSEGEKMIDYYTLVKMSRTTNTVQELKEQLNEYIPTDRKIY